MTDRGSESESESPVIPSPIPRQHRAMSNRDWWPNQLDLSILHKHSSLSNPMGEGFNYKNELATLDVEALKQDIFNVMTTSQEWWPADYGHYGPLFIRWRGCRRHVPHRRWPGRWRRGRSTLRPLEQLAGQREPRQGAPVAVAGQAEVRPKDLLGGSDHLCRQLCLRIDGVQDVRLRLRARGDPGSPTRSSGAPRTPGLATNATPTKGKSRDPLAPIIWA